jgi:hypothetical protein
MTFVNMGNLTLKVYPEVCCEECMEVIHNHIDCPVCGGDYVDTDNFWYIYKEDQVYCECGACFELVSGEWYGENEVKIVTLQN